MPVSPGPGVTVPSGVSYYRTEALPPLRPGGGLAGVGQGAGGGPGRGRRQRAVSAERLSRFPNVRGYAFTGRVQVNDPPDARREPPDQRYDSQPPGRRALTRANQRHGR
jgi:hypothetical protein